MAYRHGYRYRAHPPVYYTIRTLVRVAFWGSALALLLGAVYGVAKAFDEWNTLPCEVSLSADFTWDWVDGTGTRDINNCAHPINTILYSNHTYEWVQDK